MRLVENTVNLLSYDIERRQTYSFSRRLKISAISTPEALRKVFEEEVPISEALTSNESEGNKSALMHRTMQQRTWMTSLFAAILVLCVLCATTAAATHIHLPSEGADHGHCALCALGATLVAVLFSFVLGLFWRRRRIPVTFEPEFFRAAPLPRRSIRPPPQTACFQ